MGVQMLKPPLSGLPRYLSAQDRNTKNPTPADGDEGYRTDLHARNYYNSALGWTFQGGVPIGHTKLAVDTTLVTFSNIPQEFKHLYLVNNGRVRGTGAYSDIGLRFNGDTTAQYSTFTMYGVAGTANASTARNDSITGAYYAGIMACEGQAAGESGQGFLYIPNYTDTTWRKQFVGFGNYQGIGYAIGGTRNGIWFAYTAINSITWYSINGGNFIAGSQFSLYGIG